MKNVLVVGLAALALVGCAKTEEAAPAAEAPAADAAAPVAGENGGVPQDTTAVAPEAPTAPVEPGATTEAKAAE